MIWYAIIFDKEMPHPHIIRAIRWVPLRPLPNLWLRFCTATGPVPFFLCFSSKYCMGSVWSSMMWGISVGKRGSKLMWRSYSTGHIPKKCNQPIWGQPFWTIPRWRKKRGYVTFPKSLEFDSNIEMKVLVLQTHHEPNLLGHRSSFISGY